MFEAQLGPVLCYFCSLLELGTSNFLRIFMSVSGLSRRRTRPSCRPSTSPAATALMWRGSARRYVDAVGAASCPVWAAVCRTKRPSCAKPRYYVVLSTPRLVYQRQRFKLSFRMTVFVCERK